MANENDVEECLISLFNQENSDKECQQTNDEKEVFTDELTVRRIYLLGRIIARVFPEHNIPYWVTGGTALGCVRHKGLIPWDDDIDICVMDKYESRLLEGKERFLLENDLMLTETYFGFRLHHRVESEPRTNSNYGIPFCDIGIMRHKKDRIECKHKTARDLWKNEWYGIDEIEPLREMIFGDFSFLVARDPVSYLKRYYGDSCLEIGMTPTLDHKTRMCMTSKVVVTTDIGFKPATPFR